MEINQFKQEDEERSIKACLRQLKHDLMNLANHAVLHQPKGVKNVNRQWYCVGIAATSARDSCMNVYSS